MSLVDRAFNAFSSVVDSALPTISGAVEAVSDPTSASSLASMAGYAPWIGAGATLLGSMMNNNTARSLAGQQQAFSASQAATIYQRGAADLAAAGINPILAYGSPASMASYTQPNIQPSLALAAGAFNSALDSQSSAALKYSQQNLTGAQAATESYKPAYTHALTQSVNASTANTNMDTVYKAEQVKKTQFEEDFIKGNIKLQDIEGVLRTAQAYLFSEQAKSQTNSRALMNSQAEFIDVQRMLKDPELSAKLKNPNLFSNAEVAKAVGDIAQPFLDVAGTVGGLVKPSTTINKTYNIRK